MNLSITSGPFSTTSMGLPQPESQEPSGSLLGQMWKGYQFGQRSLGKLERPHKGIARVTLTVIDAALCDWLSQQGLTTTPRPTFAWVTCGFPFGLVELYLSCLICVFHWDMPAPIHPPTLRSVGFTHAQRKLRQRLFEKPNLSEQSPKRIGKTM